jgi:hypothetical protein
MTMTDEEKLELATQRMQQREYMIQQNAMMYQPTDSAVDFYKHRVVDGEEPWLKSYWRPAMGWVYLVTCVTDFILFPILWSILQANFSGIITQQWSPITLLGGGLYHVAMGAIVSVTVYGRTQEKLTFKKPDY